jgi:hypothetical protein
MTIFDRRPVDDADAGALNDYLDNLASGVLAPRDEIEPDIATVASQLLQMGHRTAEPSELRTQLWEDLMNTATPVETSSLAAPIPRQPHPSPDIPARLKALPRAIVTRPRHVFELLAAAVILLGIVGAGMIGRGDGRSRPTPESAGFAPAFGSPTPRVPCGETTDQPYTDCQYLLDWLGTNTFKTDDVLADAAPQVQVQGWAITPESTQTGVEGDASAQGFVVDFVLAGAYAATFDVPVVLSHGGVTNRSVEYIDAGKVVELVRGDSVSYQLGGLVEIHNPLTTQRLEFKRGVICDGDISSFSATSKGVTTRTEGQTTLPESLNLPQLQVSLYHIQKPEGTTLLPPWFAQDAVIGPVDPQSGPEGTEGFILVVGAAQG